MARAIFRGPKRGYTLDDTDVLWLARAMVGEAGEDVTEQEAAALAYCWMDRLHLVNAIWSQTGWSLAALIRAHSQPVSPLWTDPDGDKCRAHPEACTAAHIARREKIQGLTVEYLQGLGVYQLAERFAAGDLSRTIAEPTYDFAACSLTAKQGRPCPGTNIGGNCFLTYACLKPGEKDDVIPGDVTVERSVGGQVLLGGLLVLGGIALASAAWVWLTRKWGS